MPTVAAPGNTLTNIQIKVRRLTRSPSESLLTTDQLNEYINTFVVYDFPEHLRTFNNRTTFNFWCNPFQDEYPTNKESFGNSTNPEQNPLYNFQNKYLSVHKPFYIAGFPSFYTQSRSEFFNIFPRLNSIQTIGVTGNGVNRTFAGNLNSLGIVPSPTFGVQQGTCYLKNNVLFESVDLNGNGVTLTDVPCLDATTGNPTVWGNLYSPANQPITAPLINNYNLPPVLPDAVIPTNYVNYVTGQFSLTFDTAPANGFAINSQAVLVQTGRPRYALFYDNKFSLRPVPDQPYQINFEAYIRPTWLMENDSVPGLEEWWQYIALGASKKIFEDRLDMDSVALIMPEYIKQEQLCLRRTLVQYANERVATIYTQQTGVSANTWGWGWGDGQGLGD